jgi:uncharacterized repeat protein (TIGR01451 family)
MMERGLRFLLALSVLATLAARPATVSSAGAIYYVSSSGGNDSNNGLSPDTAFKTIAKVNGLALQPGDQVLFKCGDTWRAEMLIVSKSGAASSPITFSSYPAVCADKPRLDGTQPVTGWTVYTGNIYVADLNAGANLANFRSADGSITYGINQLLRDGQRLTMGRWPNLDAGDGGYVTVAAQPGSNRLTLGSSPPAGNWVSATIHLKVIRWSMVNRDITAQSGATLTLNDSVSCPYTSDCTGWGLFINNSLSTLDSEGEWAYDKTTRKVYLYTTVNPNTAMVEGSVVLKTDDRSWGAINLGADMGIPVHDLVVDNFDLRGWFKSGIASPTNLHPDENSNLTIKYNTIRDVDDSGINLWTWVWGASDGKDGWRGGNNILIENNQIEGTNHFGIHTPSRVTTIEHNTLRDIGVIANLNESGLGCGKTGSEGTCTEDGAGLRIYVDRPDRSGYGFTVRYNRFKNIGYNGIQTFGSASTLAYNVFDHTCASKGDGGAINTFGNGSLSTTNAHDIQITNNIILDTVGNTDGTPPNFRAQFGFGIYIDNQSRNIATTGNTVAGSTASGILYQNSTGAIQNNTLFDNANVAALWAKQIAVTGGGSLSAHSGNILLSKINNAGTLGADSAALLGTSDYNQFYHANRAQHIEVQGYKSLAQWRAYSGQDAHSTEMISSTLATAELFYDDTQAAQRIYLTRPYVDLVGQPVVRTLTLQSFTSRILIPAGPPTPNLTIALLAPSGVSSSDWITYTLSAVNHGGISATQLLVTNTLPAHTEYVGGGTRVGNVISWTSPSLAPGAAITFTFTVTPVAGIRVIINDDYGVSAEGGYGEAGAPVVTLVDPLRVYLPLIARAP